MGTISLFVFSFLFWIIVLTVTLIVWVRPDFLYRRKRAQKERPRLENPRILKLVTLALLFATSVWLGVLSWIVHFFNRVIILN